MKQDLFGEKVHYEHIAPPFVLMAILNRLNNRYQSAADTEFGELTWKQMFFLHAISLCDDAPTIKDIADFMGSSHQNANRLYAKLLKGEYLVSVQDEHDHRKQRLYLTDALDVERAISSIREEAPKDKQDAAVKAFIRGYKTEFQFNDSMEQKFRLFQQFNNFYSYAQILHCLSELVENAPDWMKEMTAFLSVRKADLRQKLYASVSGIR